MPNQEPEGVRRAKTTGISTPNVELRGQTGKSIQFYGDSIVQSGATSGGDSSISTPTQPPASKSGLITSADSKRTPISDFSQMTWPALIHTRTEGFSLRKVVWVGALIVAISLFFRGLNQYRTANEFIVDFQAYRTVLLGPLLPRSVFLAAVLASVPIILLWKVIVFLYCKVSGSQVS